MVKNPPANAGDMGSIPKLGRSSGSRKWQPTPVFLPGKSHGQRSLVGYGSGDHKQSDTTWKLNNKKLKQQETKQHRHMQAMPRGLIR